jgi:hypothetical protein
MFLENFFENSVKNYPQNIAVEEGGEEIHVRRGG